MSNFIPMLSSSPPPLDDSQSFNDGWAQHDDDDDDDFGGFASAATKSEETTNFAKFNSECPDEVQNAKDLTSHDHDNADDFGGFADLKSGKDSEPGWANFSSAHSDTSPNTDSQSGFADLSSPASSSGPPVSSPKLNHDEEDDEFADFEQGPTKREILENKIDLGLPKRPNSVHFQRSEKTDTPSGTETPGSERYPGFKKSSIDNTSQDSIIDSGLSSDISPLPKSEDYPDFSEDNKSNDFDCDFTENKSVSSCHNRDNSDDNPTSCDNMSNSFQGQGEPGQGLDDSQDTLVDSKTRKQPVAENENVENESDCPSEIKSESASERTLESGGENMALQEPCVTPEGVDSGHEKQVSKDNDFANFQVGETNSDQGSHSSDGGERHLGEESSNHSSTLPQDSTVDDGDDFGGFSSLQNDADDGTCSDMSESGACSEKCDGSSPIPENTDTIDATYKRSDVAKIPGSDSSPVAEDKSSVFEKNTESESDSNSPGDRAEVDNCVIENSASVESTASEMEECSESGATLDNDAGVVENDTLGGGKGVEDEGNVKTTSDVKGVVEEDGDSFEQKDDSESNTGSKEEDGLEFGELSFRAPGTPDEGLEDGDGFDGVDGNVTGDEWAGFSSGVVTEGGAGDDDGDAWAAFGSADTPAGGDDDWAAFSGATTEPPPLPDNDDNEGTFSGLAETEPPPLSEIPDKDESEDEWAGFSGPSSSVPPPMPDDDDDDDDWGGFSAPEPVTQEASPTQDDDDEFGEFTEPPAPLDKSSPSSEMPSPAQVWSKVAKPQAAKVDSAISNCFPNLQINAALVTIATLTNVVGKELERPSKPKTTDRQKKQKSTPTVINVNIWQHLKDLENTNALTCTWSHSSNNQRLLKALAIDPRNILVTKKAAVPIFASSLGLLEPSRGGVLEPSKPGDVTEPTLVDTSKETPVQQPVAGEAIPPVEFDWGSSGLTNPLDCDRHHVVEPPVTSSDISAEPSNPIIEHVQTEQPPQTSSIEPEQPSRTSSFEPEQPSTNNEPESPSSNLEPDTTSTSSVEPEPPKTTTNSSSLLDLDFFTKNQKNNISAPSKSSAFETEFLSSIEPPKPSESKPMNSLESLLSGMKFTTTMAKPKITKDENISSAASKVLGSLPDLSFMQAKVLMFPVKTSIPE